jgi:hypothetical protein
MPGLRMKYFVLKPESKIKNDVYAQASRKAMRAYASHIFKVDQEFATELRAWADNEQQKEIVGGMYE